MIPIKGKILSTSPALGPIWPSSLWITGKAPWSPLLPLCQCEARTRIRRHCTEAAVVRKSKDGAAEIENESKRPLKAPNCKLQTRGFGPTRSWLSQVCSIRIICEVF